MFFYQFTSIPGKAIVPPKPSDSIQCPVCKRPVSRKTIKKKPTGNYICPFCKQEIKLPEDGKKAQEASPAKGTAEKS